MQAAEETLDQQKAYGQLAARAEGVVGTTYCSEGAELGHGAAPILVRGALTPGQAAVSEQGKDTGGTGAGWALWSCVRNNSRGAAWDTQLQELLHHGQTFLVLVKMLPQYCFYKFTTS